MLLHSSKLFKGSLLLLGMSNAMSLYDRYFPIVGPLPRAYCEEILSRGVDRRSLTEKLSDSASRVACDIFTLTKNRSRIAYLTALSFLATC